MDNCLPCLDRQLKVGKAQNNGPSYSPEEIKKETTLGIEVQTSSSTQIRVQILCQTNGKPFRILSRSALAEGTKVVTSVSEIMRRWKNTLEGAPSVQF